MSVEFCGPSQLSEAARYLLNEDTTGLVVVRSLIGVVGRQRLLDQRRSYPGSQQAIYELIPGLSAVDQTVTDYWQRHGYTGRSMNPRLNLDSHHRPGKSQAAQLNVDPEFMWCGLNINLGLGPTADSAVWEVKKFGDDFRADDGNIDYVKFMAAVSRVERGGEALHQATVQYGGDAVLTSALPQPAAFRVSVPRRSQHQSMDFGYASPLNLG